MKIKDSYWSYRVRIRYAAQRTDGGYDNRPTICRIHDQDGQMLLLRTSDPEDFSKWESEPPFWVNVNEIATIEVSQ